MSPLLLSAALVLAAPPPPRFVADSTAATASTGRLVELDSAKVVLEDSAVTFATDTLVALRREGRALPPWPRDSQIVLANGDRFAGIVVGGDAQAIQFRPVLVPGEPQPETWTVPLSALAAIWLTSPPADSSPDPAKYPWREAARRGDAIRLRNGDVLLGVVDAIEDGPAVRLTGAKGQPARTVAFAQVAAVAFDPTLARVRKPKGAYYRIVTASGARLSAANITSTADTVSGTTLFGAKFQLPLPGVVAVDVLQGKAVYLSDLKPKAAVTEGYIGTGWPWAADRSVKGLPLRLPGAAGESWLDKGLGTHPRTKLTYDLSSKYRRFEAAIGLDAATGRRGSAVVRVLVDGKPVVSGLALSGGAAPTTIRVPVAGAKELTLVVEFGPAGDVQADVNWADARLIE